MNRLVIVPDATLEPLAASLRGRLTNISREVQAEHLPWLLGETGRRLLLRTVAAYPGKELLAWGATPRAHVAAWSSVTPNAEVTGEVTADLEEGLVAQVFMSGRAERETGSELQAGAWTNLEEKRGRGVSTMAASPLLIFGHRTGVLTLSGFVGDKPAGAPADSELSALSEAAALLCRLVEDRLLRACLGWEAL